MMISPIDVTVTDTTIQGQSESESNDNEAVFHISQSSGAGTSPSYGLESYTRTLIREGVSYPSAQMKLVYFIAPAD